MPTPKSVVKIKQSKKNGVTLEYVSSVDQKEYYIFELARAALRDSAKLVVKKFKERYYQEFKKITGDAGKATRYNVLSNKNTIKPRVEIGLQTGKVDGFYAYFQEVGTSKTPRKRILYNSVADNINDIQKIQGQYLSAINDNPESLIKEGEMNSDNE